MPLHIHDADSYDRASQKIVGLIDSGAHREAVEAAEAMTSGAGLEAVRDQLVAWALTEGGERLGERQLVGRGGDLYRSLGSLTDPLIAYNVANTDLALFKLDIREVGYVEALIRHRQSLESARRLYDQVGHDASADVALRVQALTNSANAFDAVGRNLEALRRYDEAIALDADFGMALGNRAITLVHYAQFHEHSSMLIALAIRDLNGVLRDRDRVVAIGGPGSLKHFQEVRSRVSARKDVPLPTRNPASWKEAHARWCFTHELFLHVSHHCLRPDDAHYDAVFVRQLSSGHGTQETRRVYDLVDALNVLVQEFVAARYLTWLAIAPEAPVVKQAAAISARVPFHDSLMLARWGARTAMALQALSAATNLLDKVAAFLHLYFRTGRRRQDVYFRGFWKAPKQRGQPMAMEPAFIEHLSGAEDAAEPFNLGLLALCDLARDLDADTPLARLLGLRHAATHRFLVAHHGMAPESSEWLERLEWNELVRVMLEQLGVARAALIYLVRTVDLSEACIVANDLQRGVRRASMTLRLVDPGAAELD